MLWETWKLFLRNLERTQGNYEKGQGLVEYAMILVLVVIIVIVLVSVLGPWVGNVYSNIVTTL